MLRRVVDLGVGVDTVSRFYAKTRADIRVPCEASQVPPRSSRHALEERLEMRTGVQDQRPHQRLDVAAVQVRTAVVQSAEDFAVAQLIRAFAVSSDSERSGTIMTTV